MQTFKSFSVLLNALPCITLSMANQKAIEDLRRGLPTLQSGKVVTLQSIYDEDMIGALLKNKSTGKYQWGVVNISTCKT